MRLVACALSTVLLSGCSWLGIGGNSHGNHQAYESHNSGRYAKKAGHYGHQAGQARMGPCQISSPMQPVPQGCRPEQVTLALGNQQAGHYGQSGYTSGGYGSHAGDASASTQYHTPKSRKKRPLLRGSFGLEIDHSVSGTLFEPGIAGGAALYDRLAFQEGSSSVNGATRQDIVYTSVPESIEAPTISFDDVYTAPLRITGGVEFIMSDHATVFANAGFTRAEGKKGGGASIVDELQRQVTDTPIDPVTGAATGPGITNIEFIPNVEVARFNTDFNELEKYDFEVGGRYYLDPVLTSQLNRTLTPFVAASGGAAHYNDTTVIETQSQLFLGRAFDSGLADSTFYDVPTGNVPTQIYDAQWVPYGQVKGGLEWQMTPKTALAFEAGIKYEGARDFSDGTPGDDIISVPVSIRGSYNF